MTAPDLHPAAAAARAEQIRRLALEVHMESLFARVEQARADDPDDRDVTADHAAAQVAKANQAASRLAQVAGLQGGDSATALAGANDEHVKRLGEHLEQWRNQLAVHQDFVGNPEAYGGVDLAGRPLDMDKQRGFVRAYEAAIAHAEADLGTPAATTG